MSEKDEFSHVLQNPIAIAIFYQKKTNFAPKLDYYDFKLHHLER